MFNITIRYIYASAMTWVTWPKPVSGYIYTDSCTRRKQSEHVHGTQRMLFSQCTRCCTATFYIHKFKPAAHLSRLWHAAYTVSEKRQHVDAVFSCTGFFATYRVCHKVACVCGTVCCESAAKPLWASGARSKIFEYVYSAVFHMYRICTWCF